MVGPRPCAQLHHLHYSSTPRRPHCQRTSRTTKQRRGDHSALSRDGRVKPTKAPPNEPAKHLPELAPSAAQTQDESANDFSTTTAHRLLHAPTHRRRRDLRRPTSPTPKRRPKCLCWRRTWLSKRSATHAVHRRTPRQCRWLATSSGLYTPRHRAFHRPPLSAPVPHTSPMVGRSPRAQLHHLHHPSTRRRPHGPNSPGAARRRRRGHSARGGHGRVVPQTMASPFRGAKRQQTPPMGSRSRRRTTRICPSLRQPEPPCGPVDSAFMRLYRTPATRSRTAGPHAPALPTCNHDSVASPHSPGSLWTPSPRPPSHTSPSA